MSTTEMTTIAPTGTWQLDRVHSTVSFEVAYLAGIFKGEFREVDATLATVAVPSSAAVSATSRVASTWRN